ncbi:DUF1559 family PulG-like putative transporter [Limnoglobus roseus]|uniref:DUF1559 domain-containing protein n=1 Tax=Limnoglobus roseus TaxID=2598579 RepID=A0A5C1AHT6_9BACT|nr:DUF1559 domain-containing protein [Limnoglobus roseus]QEL18205.1 hypothetical protein PX52LOC_05219 [Limnoglobus roseus]
MGRRIVIVVLVAGLLILFAGALATWLVKTRYEADRESTRNSLRQLGQFAASYNTAVVKNKPLPSIVTVPPGTVFRPDIAPDRRLSWVVQMLPVFDQRHQDTAKLLAQIDMNQPWDAEGNAKAGQTRVRILLCPARPPLVVEGEPFVTQFVGIAGVGADAATLPLDDPRAGAFRYDTPTPLSAFPDGLSNTLLFGQTNYQLGPWIRGGPSTVRGLLDGEKLLGDGGQFGGIDTGGTFFGFADGHVANIRDGITPAVLKALATRAGGKAESEQIAD